MTLLEHVYAVRNLLSQGPSSDDTPYSLRLIAHFLSVARSRLIEQKADKYHFISEQSFQSLCLDLESSQFHNCCEGPDLDCLLLKSTIELPKFLNTRWGDFIKVMTLDGRVLPKITLTQSRLSAYALTPAATSAGYFVHDNYLYIVHNTLLEKVLLNSLFVDPQQISQLNCPTSSENCPDLYEEEFPIDPDLIDPMYRLALEFLTAGLRTPQDLENDAKHTVS